MITASVSPWPTSTRRSSIVSLLAPSAPLQDSRLPATTTSWRRSGRVKVAGKDGEGYNLYPPTNITNLFANLLVGVSKKDKVQIRVGVCALLCAILNIRNDYIFNNAKFTSCRLFRCYAPDSYVVLPTTNGETRGFGHWVQPARKYFTGFIQPVQLAFWSSVNMLVQHRPF
jgi:hypothetical protein